MSTTTRRSRWLVPSLGVAMAATFFVLFAVNGHVAEGVATASVMLAYTGVLLLGSRRSQYVRMLRGQDDDERTSVIQQRAGLFSGQVVLVAILIGFFQAIARDVDTEPYSWLGALSGATYFVALMLFRRTG